jgi:hypothetical protein
MRHFLLFGHVAALPRGMLDSAFRTRLIALSGLFYGKLSGKLCTAVRTVAIAVVAGTTDKNLFAAASAAVTSSRGVHQL